jgi:hypothetical protein
MVEKQERQVEERRQARKDASHWEVEDWRARWDDGEWGGDWS